MVNKSKKNEVKSKAQEFDTLVVYSFKEDQEALKKAFNILFQEALANHYTDTNDIS